MATISDYLTSINSSKQAIKAAIKNKGVSIDDSTALADYASKIDSISAGSSTDFANFLGGAATSLSDSNATKIADKTLMNYTTLESLTMPHVTDIGVSAIRLCTNLKTMSLDAAKNVGAYALYGCSALTAIKFPSVEQLGAMACGNCTALTQVDIGANAASISGNVFSGCTALQTINVNRANKALPYAPWGAPSTCAVNWIGDN